MQVYIPVHLYAKWVGFGVVRINVMIFVQCSSIKIGKLNDTYFGNFISVHSKHILLLGHFLRHTSLVPTVGCQPADEDGPGYDGIDIPQEKTQSFAEDSKGESVISWFFCKFESKILSCFYLLYVPGELMLCNWRCRYNFLELTWHALLTSETSCYCKKSQKTISTASHSLCCLIWHLGTVRTFGVMYDHTLSYACKSPGILERALYLFAGSFAHSGGLPAHPGGYHCHVHNTGPIHQWLWSAALLLGTTVLPIRSAGQKICDGRNSNR